MYNHSLFSADRATHLKIVLVPLVAVLFLGLGAMNARSGDAGTALKAPATVAAGHAASAYASSASGLVR